MITQGVFRGATALQGELQGEPLFIYLPLPENAGRGTKGVGHH